MRYQRALLTCVVLILQLGLLPGCEKEGGRPSFWSSSERRFGIVPGMYATGSWRDGVKLDGDIHFYHDGNDANNWLGWAKFDLSDIPATWRAGTVRVHIHVSEIVNAGLESNMMIAPNREFNDPQGLFDAPFGVFGFWFPWHLGSANEWYNDTTETFTLTGADKLQPINDAIAGEDGYITIIFWAC